MLKLEIAGMRIVLVSEKLYAFDRFIPFESEYDEDIDLKIYINSCDDIPMPEGNVLIDRDTKWQMNSSEGNSISVFVCWGVLDEVICKLDVDMNWNKAVVTFRKSIPNIEYVVVGLICNTIMNHRVLFHQGIVIHASAVEYCGKGILFTAPSGTGKSTQASLWELLLGATVLNDDCPIVRVVNGQSCVYGTPWSGASDKFVNNSAPLSAIVVLEQASENKIHKLSKQEIVSKIMPRCFLPFCDHILMDLAISNLEKIISITPVYLLQCRPDREAVELVYQCVK